MFQELQDLKRGWGREGSEGGTDEAGPGAGVWTEQPLSREVPGPLRWPLGHNCSEDPFPLHGVSEQTDVVSTSYKIFEAEVPLLQTGLLVLGRSSNSFPNPQLRLSVAVGTWYMLSKTRTQKRLGKKTITWEKGKRDFRKKDWLIKYKTQVSKGKKKMTKATVFMVEISHLLICSSHLWDV